MHSSPQRTVVSRRAARAHTKDPLCHTFDAMPPDPSQVQRLAAQSRLVVARSDLLALGATPDWISGRVTSGRWQRLLPGVYATFTGAPPWEARASAALLYAGQGAVLSHDSARHRWFGDFPSSRLEVSVPATRRVASQACLVIHHRRRMPEWSGIRTPATTPAETVLDLAARLSAVDDVVGLLTTAARAGVPSRDVVAALARRQRHRHRALIGDVLAEVDAGVESPLERHYHRDVERAHGLPCASLQVRERLAGQWVRADCRYREFRVRVELDGGLAHPRGRTDADTWRDNAALLEAGDLTLRYRWTHTTALACRTAGQVAQALRMGGWTGDARRCGPRCRL